MYEISVLAKRACSMRNVSKGEICRFMKYLLVLVFCFSMISPVLGAIYDNKKVSTVSSQLNQECTFFKLEGIEDADSSTPGNPWFAINSGNAAHNSAVSILLTAYAASKSVRVSTTGNTICGGYAGIHYVRFSE